MLYVYLAIFPFVLNLFFKNSNMNKKNKKFFLIICFFQLFIFFALRSIEVGKDTAGYINTYDNFDTSSQYAYLFTHYEVGFQIFYKILKLFNASNRWILIISGFVIMTGFAIYIYKNSNNMLLSVFIFTCMFYPNSFNIMRQYMAVAIAINSFQYMKNNKYIKAILLILTGALFHHIGLLLLIPVLLYWGKFLKIASSFLVILLIFVIFFPNQLMNTVFSLFSTYDSYSSNAFLAGRTIRFTTILTTMTLILVMYAYYKRNNYEINIIYFFIFIFICNEIAGFLYLNYEIMSRVIEVLNIYLIVALPYIIGRLRSYYKPLIEIVIYIIPFVYLISSIINNGSGTNNYTMFF